MNNKNLLNSTMTNYDYYVDIAKAIVNELEQGREGTLSMSYVESKLKILNEFPKQIKIAKERQEENVDYLDDRQNAELDIEATQY